MNKFLLCLSFLPMIIVLSCNASSERTGEPNGNLVVAKSSASTDASGQCSLAPSFKNSLAERGFSVSGPVLMTKGEIPTSADNIKAVQKLFQSKEEVFNTFSTLNRYRIDKKNSTISARFYCFKFANSESARAWFDTVDKTPSKNKRHITFKKPKKLMAISKNQIYLVEGYHIATYDVLHLIIDQLPEIEAILGPKETIYKQ
jgi:hypothetical protein